MTSKPPPEWLERFQSQFGAAIRTPLDRASGTLTATPAAYHSDLVADASATDRLAVYNRQYWFRLFSVLQGALPLTTRLLGHWAFNDYAARFLLATPPRGWDIDRATDGFEAFLVAALDQPPLIEAVRIDFAWHRVFTAPATTPFRPSAADAERLLDARLVLSPAVALLEQHWPLLELRRAIRDDPNETPVPLPAKLDQVEHRALVRTENGIGELPLEPREAELFTLLGQHTVADALARLESACPENERVELPARTRAWLARSMKLDLWVTPRR